MHALRVVGKGEKGRGKSGGYSEYARAIGKTQQYISMMVASSEVFDSVKNYQTSDSLIDKTNHLYEISRAPESLWPTLRCGDTFSRLDFQPVTELGRLSRFYFR